MDIGVHQDGLVHISKLADRFVKNPNDIVKVQQQVEVTVLEVDEARKRITLSMQKNPAINNINSTESPSPLIPLPRVERKMKE